VDPSLLIAHGVVPLPEAPPPTTFGGPVTTRRAALIPGGVSKESWSVDADAPRASIERRDALPKSPCQNHESHAIPSCEARKMRVSIPGQAFDHGEPPDRGEHQ